MRVLLTGATGFVGSHIARALIDAGHEVRLLVRSADKVLRVFGPLSARFELVTGDMTDPVSVSGAIADRDAVVHAAAVVSLGRKNRARVLGDNRLGVEMVLGRAVESGVPRVVYVSSLAALLRPGGPPVSAQSPVACGKSPYSLSKAECERYARALQERGAPIRISYPPGVIGPDDPGLSESNHGLLAFFRDATLLSDSGLQMVDVRDLAEAHLKLLRVASTPGRHVLGGHFLTWAELADLLEDVSGRRLRRWTVPGSLLRTSGRVGDAIKRIWDFPLPLTHEAMQVMTQWPGVVSAPADDPLGVTFRSPRETLRDMLRWMHRAGHLRAEHVRALL